MWRTGELGSSLENLVHHLDEHLDQGPLRKWVQGHLGSTCPWGTGGHWTPSPQVPLNLHLHRVLQNNQSMQNLGINLLQCICDTVKTLMPVRFSSCRWCLVHQCRLWHNLALCRKCTTSWTFSIGKNTGKCKQGHIWRFKLPKPNSILLRVSSVIMPTCIKIIIARVGMIYWVACAACQQTLRFLWGH